MTRGELKSDAKAQIRGNVGKIFVMSLLIFVITFVCGLIPVIGWIALLIISPAFTLSLCIVYLKLTNDDNISVGNVFDGFNRAGRALWLNILINIFTFLWSCLFFIPGIIKSYAYSMAHYVLADDPSLTARESITRSRQIMKGHKFDYFILQLSFIPWHILVSLTFGLAAIYVVPYINATTANFYNSIK